MAQQAPQKVVISGASGGIGAILVDHFLKDNAVVYGIDKTSPSKKAADLNYSFFQADLSIYDDVLRVAGQLIQQTASLDLLVNCAGVFIEDTFSDEMPARLSCLLSNNVASAIYLSYSLHSLLQKGSDPMVVMISSADAVVASGGQGCEIGIGHDILYATSKGALLAFTRALAMKWAPTIRVNTICPTIVRTPMTDSLLAVPGKENELIGHIPLGRIAEAKDVAEAVSALYALKMTTAHLLPVDGGYLCQ